MAADAKKTEILALARVLAGMDYYQILKIDRAAKLPEIKKAFFRESQSYHPDRYYGSADAELKEAVNTIYKRIAEAYAVVRDPELRAKYDSQLASGQGVRLDRREAEKPPLVAAEPKAKNPQAQKYLQLAMTAFRKGDWNAAEMNFKFAANFEPGNADIQKKLKETQEKKAAAAQGKDPYKIM